MVLFSESSVSPSFRARGHRPLSLFLSSGNTRSMVVYADAKKGMVARVPVSDSKFSLIPWVPAPNQNPRKRLREPRHAKVSNLLDSMRASSPARAKPASATTRAASVDDEQKSWILRHPSALSMFEEITKTSMGKKIVMFLDYDGTLSPIVEDPDRAFMSPEMRETLKDTATLFPTAIVSGRCRDKVFSFVKLTELYYAGSHGMDIKGPPRSCSNGNKSGKPVLCQPASEFLPMMDKAYRALVESTKSIPGAKVETNKFCLSIHFRCVDEKSWAALAKRVELVLREYPKLKLTIGRKVLEIRPTIEWDKGKALEFLLEALGFATSDDGVLPIYIGDDRTDEDAFKVLRERGQGVGILVSKVPKETSASYSLQEPSEVMRFLCRLAEWKRQSL